MLITNEVLDQILKDYEKPEDLLSEKGLLQQLTKAIVKRALNGEMTHHLGYGHVHRKTTAIYAHIKNEYLRAALETVSEKNKH